MGLDAAGEADAVSGRLGRRALLAGGAMLPAALGAARAAAAGTAPATPGPVTPGLATPGSVTPGSVTPGPAMPGPMPPLDTEPFRPEAVLGHVQGPSIRFAGTGWTVREDRTRPDGDMVLVSEHGRMLRLRRHVESFAPPPGPACLGLDPKRLGLSGPDLLADALLAGGGDPDPERVRLAAPAPATLFDPDNQVGRLPWSVFIGTRQGTQPMPLAAGGSTRTLHASQVISGLPDPKAATVRAEGLLGGALPIVVQQIPAGPGRFWEVLTVADTAAAPGPLVPAVQRFCLVEHGRVAATRYRGTYPGFGPFRPDLSADAFFTVLLRAVADWTGELAGMATCRLPDPAWSDMARHAFLVELVTKPGGVHPSYGAVDRDYAGSEYDGFQDTITGTLLANLLWGRFAQAAAILDNALSVFTGADGLAVMRGQEVGQTGLTLHLVARFVLLTGDASLPARHRDRIRAIAAVLTTLHDESLALPATDPAHGLPSGWSESDSCLFPDPSIWWKPYYGNAALAARGLGDLAAVWTRIDPAGAAQAADWSRRADALSAALERSLRGAVRHELSPPYVPILPGARDTFRDSLAAATPERPSEQQWPHRVYSELLQAGVLPRDLERLTIDSMRGHGATSMGVVANIGAPAPGPRDLLGFISYGYAEALLRQDRIPDYLLFLYAHRFHCHTPGSWTAAEVAGLDGGLPLFCIPAQMTVPILLRWMLAYEDREAAVLHLGRAIPREWWNHPDGIAAEALPTLWGRVGFSAKLDAAVETVPVAIDSPPAGVTLLLHLRLPPNWRVDGIVDNPPGISLVSDPHPALRMASTGGRIELAVRVRRVR